MPEFTIARILCAGMAVMLLSASLSAETVTLTPVADNTLYDYPGGDISNGAGSAMFSGRNSEPTNRRAVVMFDIAAEIPAGAQITGVSLTLHHSAANSGAETVALHRILTAWGEGDAAAPGGQGMGTAATPGSATWLHTFYDDQLWSTPGGDFVPQPSAIQTVGASGPYMWSSAPGMRVDVQLWLDQPQANFGWMVIGNESEAGTAKRFGTREQSNPTQRPQLMVSYAPATVAVPATRTGAMVAVVVVLLVGLARVGRASASKMC